MNVSIQNFKLIFSKTKIVFSLKKENVCIKISLTNVKEYIYNELVKLFKYIKNINTNRTRKVVWPSLLFHTECKTI